MQPGDDFRTLLMRHWVAGVRPWTISILGVVALALLTQIDAT